MPGGALTPDTAEDSKTHSQRKQAGSLDRPYLNHHDGDVPTPGVACHRDGGSGKTALLDHAVQAGMGMRVLRG
jgi:hypothetical protein